MTIENPEDTEAREDAYALAIERPHKSLLIVYVLRACATLIAAPIVVIPFLIKFYTLRYQVDEEGVSASWGVFFRREIYLTYRRIQDIHVKRNLFERWLGIARVEIQTASGSSSAELTLEGLEDYEAARNFLYRRMRGARSGKRESSKKEQGLVEILHAIRAEVELTRAAVENANKESAKRERG